MIINDKYSKDYLRSLGDLEKYLIAVKYPKVKISNYLKISPKTLNVWLQQRKMPPLQFINVAKLINSKK